MQVEPTPDGSDRPLRDEAIEALLGDDLMSLGQQLCDDALHLASQYPAPSADEVGRSVRDIRRAVPALRRRAARRLTGRLGTWAALASVALLVCVSWGAYRSAVQENRSPLQTASPVTASTETESIAPVSSAPVSVGAEDRLLDPLPASFLQDVSGPEMEGLFDLWEQEAPARTSVSI